MFVKCARIVMWWLLWLQWLFSGTLWYFFDFVWIPYLKNLMKNFGNFFFCIHFKINLCLISALHFKQIIRCTCVIDKKVWNYSSHSYERVKMLSIMFFTSWCTKASIVKISTIGWVYFQSKSTNMFNMILSH